MFDALLAFARKIAGDDETASAELAALESAVADAKTQSAADEATIADLQAKVAALGAPVDTSTFALKSDIPDVSGFAKQADLDALDAQFAALSQAAATPALAPSPGAPAPEPAPPAADPNAPLPNGPITATSGQPDTTAPAGAAAPATGGDPSSTS